MIFYLYQSAEAMIISAHGGGNGQPSVTYVPDVEAGCRIVGRTYEEYNQGELTAAPQ